MCTLPCFSSKFALSAFRSGRFRDFRGQRRLSDDFSRFSAKTATSTMSDGEKLSRKMVFPYTFTAKVAQFPFKLHWNHHWMFPWFVGAVVLVTPLFYQLQKAANCEANVKIWADKRRQEEEHHKHKWD